MALRLTALLIFICHVSSAQYFSKEKELIQHCETATIDAGKIKALGELAEFYYIFHADKKGDSVLQKQLLVAELSNNEDLVLETLFNSAINNISEWSSTEAFEKALAFLDKGLDYAREMKDDEKQSLAYLRKAMLLRKKGEQDNALQQALLSLTSANNTDNDSLKVMIYLEMGDIFLAKRDAVSAYKNYNSAFDIAYKIQDPSLQSEIYHHFSTLYQSLSDDEGAKKNLLKSLDLNLQSHNSLNLMNDYYDLARLTAQKEYIDKLLELAKKENSYYFLFKGEQVMFAYLMVVEKNSDKALQYLSSHEELNQSYLNTGLHNYNWNIGNVFRYSNHPDSALKYYTLAAPGFQNTFDAPIKKVLYQEMGECYYQIKQWPKAISCFQKAIALSEETNDLNSLLNISKKLTDLYAGNNDFPRAFAYSKKYMTYKDTLEKLAAQKEVVLLEVDRENKKHEQDLADQTAKTLRIQNLQYIGISIAIAAVFTFMLLLGMFPVSKFTIKFLSFMAFICLFEFIVMLIDNYLHKITHNQPLKIWLIKIFLIATLVPVQHFMESGVVRFLASQRLLRMRQQLSLKRLWTALLIKIKKPVSVTNTGIEEDTAVL